MNQRVFLRSSWILVAALAACGGGDGETADATSSETGGDGDDTGGGGGPPCEIEVSQVVGSDVGLVPGTRVAQSGDEVVVTVRPSEGGAPVMRHGFLHDGDGAIDATLDAASPSAHTRKDTEQTDSGVWVAVESPSAGADTIAAYDGGATVWSTQLAPLERVFDMALLSSGDPVVAVDGLPNYLARFSIADGSETWRIGLPSRVEQVITYEDTTMVLVQGAAVGGEAAELQFYDASGALTADVEIGRIEGTEVLFAPTHITFGPNGRALALLTVQQNGSPPTLLHRLVIVENGAVSWAADVAFPELAAGVALDANGQMFAAGTVAGQMWTSVVNPDGSVACTWQGAGALRGAGGFANGRGAIAYYPDPTATGSFELATIGVP